MHPKWTPLVPDNFTAPREHKHGEWVFSQLVVEDIDEDYAVVMGSADRLRGMFDFFPAWPDKKMTKAEDLSNLGWHQTEFEMRTSFAYKIQQVRKGHREYVGCAYVFPSNNPAFEVDAYLWVKSGYEVSNSALFGMFKQWIKDVWPFNSVNYPNRNRAYKT